MSGKEKDKVDEQVGLYTRGCAQLIQRLEQSIAAEGQDFLQLVAHMHGVVGCTT